MELRSFIESEYAKQTEGFVASDLFKALANGALGSQSYNGFIANICKSHLKSPRILAFLFALVPPSDENKLKHNMLEELGLDEEGISHPGLLMQLAEAAGFDEQARLELEALADEEIRRTCSEPILFATLKEIGLSILLETTCFEWMLSRLASLIARFLREHQQLSEQAVMWFTHHAEVDRRHAEEGLAVVVNYIEFYGFEPVDLRSILEVTFRENVFIKRYFGGIPLVRQTSMES
jgi:pyrroloquinoline quinone (PQQ) biosynthesis protein C